MVIRFVPPWSVRPETMPELDLTYLETLVSRHGRGKEAVIPCVGTPVRAASLLATGAPLTVRQEYHVF